MVPRPWQPELSLGHTSWPPGSLVSLHQHKVWAQLPGALRELEVHEDTAGTVTWYLVRGVTDIIGPTEGQRKSSTCRHGAGVPVCLSPASDISGFLHVSLLGCIPHSTKGKLMCGDLKLFGQGQEC